jgi:hypothetical protein
VVVIFRGPIVGVMPRERHIDYYTAFWESIRLIQNNRNNAWLFGIYIKRMITIRYRFSVKSIVILMVLVKHCLSNSSQKQTQAIYPMLLMIFRWLVIRMTGVIFFRAFL